MMDGEKTIDIPSKVAGELNISIMKIVKCKHNTNKQLHYIMKVQKRVQIRNLYNQSHLTYDTISESDKNTKKYNTQES